ncbi:MAG: flagellar hook-associated protein FlgL [Gammaproteobacteria bacterium]|nr:flagellar hook-associated protein FlgL [Gammaproteobacteria bacterium]
MRISSRQYTMNFIHSLQDQQSKLAKTGEQMATGKRVITPSDDPVAATRILSLRESVGMSEQYGQNGTYVRNRLETEESMLASVTDVLQRTRELTIAAASSSMSDQDRISTATEVRARLEHLMGIANSQDANGEYMFSGSKDVKPFTYNGANYIYNGDDTARELQIGQDFNMIQSDPGSEVFMRITEGNGRFFTDYNPANTGAGKITGGQISNVTLLTDHDYTITYNGAPVGNEYSVFDNSLGAALPGPFPQGSPLVFDGIEVEVGGSPAVGDQYTIEPSSSQSVFATLDRLIKALETPKASPSDVAKIAFDMDKSIVDIDNALDHILDMRGRIGGRLNTLDGQDYVNEDMKIQLKSTMSSLEDLDYAEAVGRHDLQLVGLQAAQQTYTRAQGLSLFNYIN